MERRYDLDWIRICAFGVLVLYHVGMYYVTWDWHVNSPHAGPALEPLMRLASPWRLSLLFLVSGAATAFLWERCRGDGRSFLGPRSWRLLLPLVFGMLVIVPPQSYFEVVEKLPGGYHDGYLAFWRRYLAGDGSFCRDDDCLALPTWNHLWFLAYLWCYTAVLWALLRFAPRATAGAVERLRALLARPGGLLWPLAWLAIARMLLVGRFESTHALVDDWYNHAQYLPLFLLGCAIARPGPLWERIEAARWPALGAALAAWLYLTWYFGHYADGMPPPEPLRWLQRLLWSVQQWGAIVAILGFARRLAPGDSPARRWLGEAVFPVYILHQTVIVLLAVGLQPLDLSPWIEGPLLVLATFALCFAAYAIIRRLGWLRPLFGLRRRPPPPPPRSPPPPPREAADVRS
ncbi:acyltransferase family protein [Pseudoxanthomonas suwonensis]|uniref:acyltransferase family protein n=1 Tax=Pseudoxanthomonas suwonensis TaxID=314722 RepID=UPI0009E46CA0|nr:acyltransferase family protein [Pseudoxanthomonas suwonensis]